LVVHVPDVKGRRGEIVRPRSAKHPGDPAVGGQGPVDESADYIRHGAPPFGSVGGECINLPTPPVELTLRRHRTFPGVSIPRLTALLCAFPHFPGVGEAHFLLVGAGRLDLSAGEAGE